MIIASRPPIYFISLQNYTSLDTFCLKLTYNVTEMLYIQNIKCLKLTYNVTQIKDMALKFSGAYKQCKPCSGSSSSPMKKGHRSFPDYDNASEGVPYPYMGGSAGSTPAWDFTNSSHNPANRSETRFTSIYGNDRESISAQSCDVVLDDEGPKEWMAQVEPGVHITFASLPSGGNDLKRIRFR